MFFLIIISSVLCFISFDSQSSSVFNPPASGCYNNNKIDSKITFSGTFKNIPQIIIADSWYFIQSASPVEFTIVIPQNKITTTSFTITIACPQVYQMHRMEFRWAAIDDQRIQVITDLVNTTGITSPKIYTYDIQNPNLNQGFMSLLSFGETGVMDFNLAIDSITSQNVSIKLTTSNNNLLSVGFQAVLGTSEALNKSGIINFKLTKTTLYNSNVLTVSPGYKLLVPFCGINFNFVNSLSFGFTYNDNSATTGQITYGYTASINQLKLGWLYRVERLSFREVWINTQMTKILLPFYCKKVRVSNLYDINFLSYPVFSLQIDELAQTFISTSGTTQIIINNTIQTLNMRFRFRCLPTKKVQSQLIKCSSCSPSNYVIQQNCYGGANTLFIHAQFYQTESVYQNLTIQATASGFIITQNVYNKEIETYTLADTSISLI